jgi:two-component system CheB/CheR fusion protein
VQITAPDLPELGLYLLLLQDTPIPQELEVQTGSDHAEDDSIVLDPQAQIQALKNELRAKGEHLQNTHYELEYIHEQLESSHIEMRSVIEELHSANEELETSKEELYAINQELTAVNTELQTRVGDLTHANNDINNLLSGSGVCTVFVDIALRIVRFTPAVRSIVNLIVSDVGRPLAHIVCNLVNYTTLIEDIKAVLSNLMPIEREVQTSEGQWFALRIQPYRTLDNVVEGAVVSFLGISENVRVREALVSTQALMELTGALAKVGAWELDMRTRKLCWSLETFRIHDLSPATPPTLEESIHFHPPEARSAIQAGIQGGIDHGQPWDIELPLNTATGRSIWVRSVGAAVMEQGKVIKLHGAIQNITERIQVEESLRRANALLLAQAKAAD